MLRAAQASRNQWRQRRPTMLLDVERPLASVGKEICRGRRGGCEIAVVREEGRAKRDDCGQPGWSADWRWARRVVFGTPRPTAAVAGSDANVGRRVRTLAEVAGRAGDRRLNGREHNVSRWGSRIEKKDVGSAARPTVA